MTKSMKSHDRARRAAEAVAKRRHLSVTLTAAVLSALLYAFVALAAWGSLPESLATNFDASGQGNTLMPTPVALLLQFAVVLLVPGSLLAAFGASQWWRGEYARTVTSLMVGLSVGLAVLFALLTRAHVGVTDVTELSLSWQVPLLALGAGVASGLLSRLLLPPPILRPEPEAVVPVRLAPNQRVSWFGKARTAQLFTILLVAALLVVLAATLLTGIWWLWLIDLLLLLLLVGFSSFDVVIDSRGLRWRGALGFPRGAVALSDVTGVSLVDVVPGDFGGYGLRLLPGRLGLITRSGPALRVEHGEGELVITVDDAATAAGVLDGLRLGRGPARDRAS